MSAPNVNAPNEGIVGQVTNSLGNAVNYVSDTLQGNVCAPIYFSLISAR